MWVQRRQKRDLTPLSDCFLQLYMKSLQKASEVRSKDTLDGVQRLERKMKYDQKYVAEPSEKEKEMLKNSRELMRLRLLGRYGDYMARTVQLARTQLQKEIGLEQDVSQALSKYWTEVQTEIEEERRFQEQRKIDGSGALLVETPTIQAVTVAARGLQLNADELFTAIKLYATRNREFHSELNTVIASKKPLALAQTIFTDLQALEYFADEPEIAQYRAIVLSFRNRYFWFDPEDENNPDYWHYTTTYKEEIQRASPKASEEELTLMRGNLQKISNGKGKEKARNLEEFLGAVEAGDSPRKRNVLQRL